MSSSSPAKKGVLFSAGSAPCRWAFFGRLLQSGFSRSLAMSVVMGNFVLGAFPIKTKALNVVHELQQAGFADSDVSIITCQEERSDEGLSEPSPLALEKRDVIGKATWTGALLGITAGSLGI